jgi:predicted TIM-barrel fold metal-dependent hydrolase
MPSPTHLCQPSRRSFVKHTIAGCASLASLPTALRPVAAANAKSLGAIDAHVHVWSPDTQRYPISGRFQKSDMQPASFTAEQLFSHCRPAGVERIVLIQMSFYEFDHTYMLEVMQAHPGVFSGVALIDFRDEHVLQRVAELAQQGVRGFRLHSQGDATTWVDDAGMTKLWRRAAELGLAICPLINPSDIPVVDALCKKFPQTTVVVDHFARIGISGIVEPADLDALCALAQHPRTYVKTSAFYALGKKRSPYEDLLPMIRRVVDSFGPQRLMWASDCPFQVEQGHNYLDSIQLINERCDFLSAEDKQWMLRGTAEKVYFA